MAVRVRIAPSPTGDPHVGTAYVGLFNWLYARQNGGQFLLRIEDTDQTRSTPASEASIMRTMKWLDLAYDEGPDVGGPCGPYRQSERTAHYREHTKLLLDKGAAYRCFCSDERLALMRERQKAAKLPPGYDGTCRNLPKEESERRAAAGEKFVVRMKIDKAGKTIVKDVLRGDIEFSHAEIDDQVLMKSDNFPTYHLANVVDDRLMGITHVLRAEEWIPSTPKHVLLYQAFGWPAPVFCHLPLLRNADRTKISKRKNPTSLDWYRAQGFLPEALVNFLALMGFAPSDGSGSEVFDRQQLMERFALEKVSLGGPVFDLTKLEWLNGEWIRRLSVDAMADRLVDFMAIDFPDRPGRKLDPAFVRQVVPLIQERMKKLSEWDEWTDFFFKEVVLAKEAFRRAKLAPPELARVLTACADLLAAVPGLDHGRDEPALRDLATRLGVKVGDLFMAMRVAVTGKSATPPLLESMELLGKEKSLARLRAAAKFLSEGDPAEL
ncbi:MAG: glutamate--tRNA ligase [Planctomycetes bacterium]|nr:glutamate--tRNA ligase [Planctomycetota bacterium]